MKSWTIIQSYWTNWDGVHFWIPSLVHPLWVEVGQSRCYNYPFHMLVQSSHFYCYSGLLLGSYGERYYGMFLILVILFDMGLACLKSISTTIMLHHKNPSSSSSSSSNCLNQSEGTYSLIVMGVDGTWTNSYSGFTLSFSFHLFSFTLGIWKGV